MGGVRNLIWLETDRSSSEAMVLNINLHHKPLRGGELLFHCAGLSHSVISNTFAPSWTVVCQTPLSMEFSRQEYWNVLPFSTPEDLPDLGIEPSSAVLQADSLPLSHQGSPVTHCCETN